MILSIILHLFVIRKSTSKKYYKLSLIIGTLIFILYLSFNVLISEDVFEKYKNIINNFYIIHIINGVFLYIVTYSLYIYNFTTIERSISLNMLIDIENTGDEGLEYSKIISLVTETEVKKRMQFFLESGYISKEKDYVKITNKGKIFSSVGKLFKQLFGIAISKIK